MAFYATLEHPILAYDQQAAEYHTSERIRRTSANFADAQIAAIAVTQGLVLVTANVRDFKGFRGIQLEDWSRP